MVFRILKNKKIVIFIYSFISVFLSTLIGYSIKNHQFLANIGDCIAIAFIASMVAVLISFLENK